jgi:hypothetical protein
MTAGLSGTVAAICGRWEAMLNFVGGDEWNGVVDVRVGIIPPYASTFVPGYGDIQNLGRNDQSQRLVGRRESNHPDRFGIVDEGSPLYAHV